MGLGKVATRTTSSTGHACFRRKPGPRLIRSISVRIKTVAHSPDGIVHQRAKASRGSRPGRDGEGPMRRCRAASWTDHGVADGHHFFCDFHLPLLSSPRDEEDLWLAAFWDSSRSRLSCAITLSFFCWTPRKVS